jgi:hypothetical protein
MGTSADALIRHHGASTIWTAAEDGFRETATEAARSALLAESTTGAHESLLRRQSSLAPLSFHHRGTPQTYAGEGHDRCIARRTCQVSRALDRRFGESGEEHGIIRSIHTRPMASSQHSRLMPCWKSQAFEHTAFPPSKWMRIFSLLPLPSAGPAPHESHAAAHLVMSIPVV